MLGVFLTAATIALTAAPVSAAEPEVVGILAIVPDGDVAQILKLEQSQQERLIELIKNREIDATQLRMQLKGLPNDQRHRKLAEFRQESEALGMELLAPEQRQLLRRAWLKRRGMESLGDPNVAQMLNLSDEQCLQVMTLLQKRHERMIDADPDSRHAIAEQTSQELGALLTDEQQAKWEMITSLDAPLVPPRPSANEDSSARVPQAGAAVEQPADNLPPKPIETLAPEEPAPEAPAPEESAQPEPAATESLQPSAEDAMARPAEESNRPDDASWMEPTTRSDRDRPLDFQPEMPFPSESDSLTFNFHHQPWEDVIDWFADRAGLSVLKETLPVGTFNYRDDREYTPVEALNQLNKALLIKGYRLIKAERMLIVINLEDGIPPDLISTVSLEDLDQLSEYDLVRVLFELEKFDPLEAEQEIQKLVGPQGSVVVMPKTQQILVTDTVGNLKTMRRVIERIEDPDGISSGKVEVYRPRYILADEAMMVLRQLLDIKDEENATSDGSVRLAIDPMGTRIYYSGKSEMRAKVAEILERLDEEPAGFEEGGIESLQMEIYSVTTADPNSVLSVMQTLLAEAPGVRLSLDPKTDNLIALATPSQHATIRATLDQMQSEVRRIEVIHLRSIDPALAALSIKKVFGEASEENTSSPTVEADTVARHLLIYGTDAQIEQIGFLLEKMGEKNIGDADFVDTSTVRVLPLGGREAEAVLERIEMIWPTMHQNQIKVVTPSAVIPTLRPGSRGKPAEDEGDMLRELLKMSPDFRVPALERAEPAPPAAKPPAAQPPAAKPPAAGPVKSSLPEALPRTKKSVAADRPLGSAWVPIRLASEKNRQPQPAAQNNESAPTATQPVTPNATSPASRTTAPPAPPVPVLEEKTAVGHPPVVVSIGSGGLMIACEDVEALNEFEELVKMLSAGAVSSTPKMTVFYLIHAKAEPVAETIDAILGGGTMADGGGSSSGGGGLLGDLAGAALGDVGGGIVSSLLGFGMGGGSITPTGSIQITPDSRLNCLFVQANSADLNTIEELLVILDQSGSPEDVLADPKPQMIPVYNTQADEIAEIVQQVFQENMAGASRNRQPSPQEFIEALRGGRGGRGSSRGRSTDTTPKMSIGVDARSNSLIVSAPEALFQEVKLLVETLDEAAAESNNEAVEVVKLDSLNPEAMRAALQAVVGDNVSFGSSSSSRSRSSSGRSGSSPGRPPGSSSSDDMRRMMFMRAMQERMRSGGGSPFGGGPGGGMPFGGGRPSFDGRPSSGRPGGGTPSGVRPGGR